MSGRLEGKVALITGGAKGQGAVEARLFVDEGASVVVSDIEDVADVVALLGDSAHGVILDVVDEAQWASAVATTVDRFGRLDILINNAGIGIPPRRLTEETIEDHHRVLSINSDGVYLGIRAVTAVMSGQRGGSIVNISSIDGLAGVAGMMSYSASKFAVTGMTQVAALELGARGIRVNSIHPGVIATPMVDQAPPEVKAKIQRLLERQPIARMGTPEEVAYLALYLASDESSYCTGSQFTIDGGHLAGPYREGYGADDPFSEER
jgi:3alpha(or 20beta)-hydroxysteroid dehydrogenase